MKIYVSNYLSNSISILDAKTLSLEKEIYLEEEVYPHSFCVDNQNKLMYIPSSISGNLYILNLNDYKIIDSLSVGCNVNNILIHNNELFIANEDSNSIYVLDSKNLKPQTVIGVGEMPHGIDINTDDNKLYIPCINSIVKVDISTKKIETNKITNLKSWHLKLDKNNSEIYATTIDGKLLILDEKTMDIKMCKEDYILPVDIAISNKNNKVYVSDIGHSAVIVMDSVSKEVVKAIQINGYPQGLCLVNEDELIIVTDTRNDELKIYNTSDYKLVKSMKIGKEPTTISCL